MLPRTSRPCRSHHPLTARRSADAPNWGVHPFAYPNLSDLDAVSTIGDTVDHVDFYASSLMHNSTNPLNKNSHIHMRSGAEPDTSSLMPPPTRPLLDYSHGNQRKHSIVEVCCVKTAKKDKNWWTEQKSHKKSCSASEKTSI